MGYLTVHSQAAIERQIACKRVLLARLMGIDTSYLLKSHISRAFPDWTIVGVVLADSLPSVLMDDIELVVSTISLPAVAMPVVYVATLFSDADIRRVTETVITERLHQVTSLVVEN